MADQGRWFKLWVSALSDGHLLQLAPEIRWAWAALGAHTKEQGTRGVVTIPLTDTVLAAKMGVTTETLLVTVRLLPHLTVEEGKNGDGTFTVTWHNWPKYQEDTTGAKRMQALRSKRRREEKRGEEKKDPPTQSVKAPQLGSSEWPEEWKPIADRVTTLPFLAKYRTWLADLQWWVTLDELFTSCPKPLDGLLLEAVAYCESEGYVPRSKAGIRKKLKNCMEFAARRAEREAQERKR